MDTISKLPKVAVEYATTSESSKSNYFIDTCELFAEKLRIVKLLNPGILRKLILLGKSTALRVDNSSFAFEENKEEDNVEQMGARVFCEN